MGYGLAILITSATVFPLAFAMVLMGYGAWGASTLLAGTMAVAVLAITR